MKGLVWSLFLALLLTTATIISRPLLPVDETRCIAVAWEAHQRSDYLVSHLNNQPYSHKPPLLFWLINAVWNVTGVSSHAARMVAPVAGAACLPLTWLMARRLWPTSELAADFAPLMHASMMIWMLFSPLTMFDTFLTCFAMIGLLGVLRAEHGSAMSGWLLAGTAMGLGILSKGPVVLAHVLPAALLAPWWSLNARSRPVVWYAGCLVSVGIAAGIALCWAIPSAKAGGELYANELMFGQTAGRVVNSFAHRQPFWWYLPWVSFCLMPWICLGTVWKGRRSVWREQGLKFLSSWSLGSLLILSLVSGKQIYYLLPLTPACALIMARLAAAFETAPTRRDMSVIGLGTLGMGALPLVFNHAPWLAWTGLSGLVSDWYAVPLMFCGAIHLVVRYQRTKSAVWTISMTAVAFISVLIVSLSDNFWNGFELQPLATFAARCGRPIAWFGNYHGQLNFEGPIAEVRELLTENEINTWLRMHPHGAVVIRLSASDPHWADAMPSLKALDRMPLSGLPQKLLSDLLQGHSGFPLRDFKPQVLYVQWIRRGLTMDPLVVTTYESRAEESANMADVRQVRLQ